MCLRGGADRSFDATEPGSSPPTGSPQGSTWARAEFVRVWADRSSGTSPQGLRRAASSLVIQGGSVSRGQARVAVPGAAVPGAGRDELPLMAEWAFPDSLGHQ